MNPARLAVRFPLAGMPGDLEPAIGVFHRFIQRGLVEGLLIDVADYRHVPNGPGVRLVAHDIDYGIDTSALRVIRKRSSQDGAGTQLSDALRMALGAMAAVEDDGVLDVSFQRGSFEVAVPDRRLGPVEDVADELVTEVTPLLTEWYGDDVEVRVADDLPSGRPSTLRVNADQERADAVLGRLGGSRAPGQSPWDITVEEFAGMRQRDEPFVLVDVREEVEYNTVNLGGRLLPLATLPHHFDELDRDMLVVVHCRAGHRGAKATEQLRAAGFDRAVNVNGGLMAWIDRIDPSLPRY